MQQDQPASQAQPSITRVAPTIFLAGGPGAWRQLIRVTVDNPGWPESATVVVAAGGADATGACCERPLGVIPGGQSTHPILIDAATQPANVEFALKIGETICSRTTVAVQPPRHWVVHVVQNSHHDLGYTDLASNVLRGHARYLDEAIDMADATRDSPDDAKFRIVVEQAWSLQHFLRTARDDRAARMIELLRSGQFEVNALYGNLTTEICGHETLIRGLYQSHELKRLYGIPLTSAEHNDIPGISWGVCQALTDAGIRFFCPGLPLYYNWGNLGLESFWDQQAIFGRDGPGAFWWEAPSGRRLLFWCNNTGCGGDCRADMPGLEDTLERLPEQGYPYDVARWPVIGGARDNSPYIDGYAQTIRDWNAKWAYPRLVCSTNAKFYADLNTRLAGQPLPVHRGELPGQDYPVGATSTAGPTAVNRNTHAALLSAEKLAAAAGALTGYDYPRAQLAEAYDEALLHDEHTWGHHFPAGPAAKSSQAEKAARAYRAAALAHDTINQALARIADNIRVEAGSAAGESVHLVVFNPTGKARTGVVRTPMREIDNCGSAMAHVATEDDPRGSGYLRGVLLGTRWHLNLPPGMVEGRFDLIDVTTGARAPFQLIPIDSAADTVPHAAERAGAGAGSKRYGLFETPAGLKVDLCFVATDVPALGYKTYRLAARDSAPRFKNPIKATTETVENEFYRVTISRKKGGVESIFDKAAGRELVDPACAHAFGELIVRDPYGNEWRSRPVKARRVSSGPVCASVELSSAAHGHPAVTQTVTLCAGLKQVEIATRVLKDATPLLDAHLAFPFLAGAPQFRYEGALSVMEPIADTLPGSQSDCIAVQNWVKVSDGDYAILWSSLDAPVAGFGGLWPGYVSPAHRCVVVQEKVNRTGD